MGIYYFFFFTLQYCIGFAIHQNVSGYLLSECIHPSQVKAGNTKMTKVI